MNRLIYYAGVWGVLTYVYPKSFWMTIIALWAIDYFISGSEASSPEIAPASNKN